jgi:N utilization substance protein A
MALSPFVAAINQICDEKSLSKEVVIETVEAAIAAAYRKDYGNPNQIIRATLNPETGQFSVSQIFEVVDEVEDEHTQMSLDNAYKFNKGAKVADEIEIPLAPHSDFGRIAAQTAKQVIIQRIREAERDMLYQEFKEKEYQLLNGNVQQVEGDNVIINLGKINGVMLPSAQIPNERYYVGQRLKVYVTGVEETSKGPRVLVSRSDPQFIANLFAMEIPEINTGAVEIKSISREAGSRTKIAVFSDQPGLDPVGSCVGQRGTRVQAVLAEIGDEKIDIILWNEDPKIFIINALSPAKVENVELNEEEQKTTVQVPDDQLSLAIGRGGQNVRLASKLTGWSIDILSSTQAEEKQVEPAQVLEEEPQKIEVPEKAQEETKEETPAKPKKKTAKAKKAEETPSEDVPSEITTEEKPKKPRKSKKTASE